jgi:hypothetical protein
MTWVACRAGETAALRALNGLRSAQIQDTPSAGRLGGGGLRGRRGGLKCTSISPWMARWPQGRGPQAAATAIADRRSPALQLDGGHRDVRSRKRQVQRERRPWRSARGISASIIMPAAPIVTVQPRAAQCG